MPDTPSAEGGSNDSSRSEVSLRCETTDAVSKSSLVLLLLQWSRVGLLEVEFVFVVATLAFRRLP